MEKLIKKGERIPEEFIAFFIDGKPINKYVTAGVDMLIEREDDKIHLSTEENTQDCLYIGNNDTTSKFFIRINMDAMQNDCENINGILTQIPGYINFHNREKEHITECEINK